MPRNAMAHKTEFRYTNLYDDDMAAVPCHPLAPYGHYHTRHVPFLCDDNGWQPCHVRVSTSHHLDMTVPRHSARFAAPPLSASDNSDNKGD